MHVLDASDVHAAYGSKVVLKGITLSISAGEWFCLLGPNGVGKSTLLHCLAGRLTPARGEIVIGGQCLASHPIEAKTALGFACAPDELPELLTGRQCLEIYALARGEGAIDADIVRLVEALQFSAYLDAYVDTYSLGTRQKLCALLALTGRPRLIILDEAFNGLDLRSALILKRELQVRLREGSALLLATHSLDIVEHYAHRAALMMDGRIVRQWNAEHLQAMKSQHEGLEEALAAASNL